MQQSSTSEKIKLNLARLKKGKDLFEINVNPDLAILFRKGENIDLREVLKTDQIFSDTKKGELASESSLKQWFKTTDPLIIAEIIIKEGEIQLTSEYRSQEKEKKKRKLIELIRRNAIDPSTNLPHPPQRIELAFEEAKIKIEDTTPVEEQIDSIVSKLKPVLPIKFEEIVLALQIPTDYAAKSYSLVQKYSKILKEEWNSDGSWGVLVKIPAGLKVEFIDKLNSFTHGKINIKENKNQV